MAIHFRKLLNFYFTSTTNDTTTTTTTTIPCTDLCDPSCGDLNDCYNNFPAEPDPLPLPPLLPPLPPTTIVATPSSTKHGSFHLSPLVIVVIVVLVSAFLLVSYYAIVIKYCSFLTRLFTRRDLARMPQSNQLDDHHGGDDHDATTNQFSPVVDHPIWLISTVGLHQSIINSITVIPYKKDDGLIDGTDCSVCLSEFQEGETLRLLPKCKHAFHIDCIDTWLRSHTNCPMCRAGIVANSGRPSIASNEPSFGHSRRTEFTQMADSDSSDVELGNNNQIVNNVSLVIDNRGGETGDFEGVNDHNKVDNFVTPIALLLRRSYSMDYRNVDAQFFQPNNINSDLNSNSNSFAVMGSSSSRPLPPRGTRMKRSNSWSERVFWSTLNQNGRNSIMSP